MVIWSGGGMQFALATRLLSPGLKTPWAIILQVLGGGGTNGRSCDDQALDCVATALFREGCRQLILPGEQKSLLLQGCLTICIGFAMDGLENSMGEGGVDSSLIVSC